jgi:hypothetical protein
LRPTGYRSVLPVAASTAGEGDAPVTPGTLGAAWLGLPKKVATWGPDYLWGCPYPIDAKPPKHRIAALQVFLEQVILSG